MSNEPLLSSAYVPFPGADQAFAQLAEHFDEHDVVVERSGARNLKIVVSDSSIQVESDGNGLSLKVSAVSESILYFMKEAAVRHLAELNTAAADGLRWEDTVARAGAPDQPSNFRKLALVRKSEPIAGLLRLRFNVTGKIEQLAGPGIHVKLMLPANSDRTPVWPKPAANGTTAWPTGEDALHVRYYTIRSVNPGENSVDIDVARHAGGLISDWAESAAAGDTIGLLGPGGTERPNQCNHVLFAGDQTALPALARMLEDLPANVSGHVIGEAASLGELETYLPKTRLVLHALPPTRFSSEILNCAREMSAQCAPSFAWFAGEYKNAQEMRKLFKMEFGLGKGKQYSFTYWRKGKAHKAN